MIGLYPPRIVVGLTAFSQLLKMLIVSGNTDKVKHRQNQAQSKRERKCKLPETMWNLIPGINSVGLGTAPNVVSLNVVLLRKTFRSVAPPFVNYPHQPTRTPICGPQVLLCAGCCGRYLGKTPRVVPALRSLLGKERS